MKQNNLIGSFLLWRIKYVNDKTFVLLLASVVGVLSGMAAVLLKEAVHYLQKALSYGSHLYNDTYFYIVYPFIGILIAYIFARYFFKERLGHGITSVLYAISKRSSILKRVKTISQMLRSAFTVGFGGSVGLEAPIVVTGSAIGSNIAVSMHLNYRKRTILIGCGAAGAISAIFNSPVAGLFLHWKLSYRK